MTAAHLPARQARFVELYVLHRNAARAYRDAYGVKGPSAEASASRLLRTAKVQAAVEAAQQKVSDELGITEQWILKMLKQNLARAMKLEAVKDADGNTVEYKYQGSVANRAIELLGKHRGMWTEQVRTEDLDKLTDDELEEVARGKVPPRLKLA